MMIQVLLIRWNIYVSWGRKATDTKVSLTNLRPELIRGPTRGLLLTIQHIRWRQQVGQDSPRSCPCIWSMSYCPLLQMQDAQPRYITSMVPETMQALYTRRCKASRTLLAN